MALKKALVEIDPPSTIKSAFDVIIVGAGGWLILTALGAIIEWIIQNWLSSIL